jgi:hypothetical protein
MPAPSSEVAVPPGAGGSATAQLARSARPRLALQDGPPVAAVSRTPTIGRTGAQALARALGTEVEEEPDGSRSVTFPAPGEPAGFAGAGREGAVPAGAGRAGAVPDFVPFSTAPMTVSRDVEIEEIVTDAGPSAGGASASAPAGAGAAPPPAAAPAPELDMDEIADTVIDKLRREMLIERELGGGAMDLI